MDQLAHMEDKFSLSITARMTDDERMAQIRSAMMVILVHTDPAFAKEVEQYSKTEFESLIAEICGIERLDGIHVVDNDSKTRH
jgi:hypothetical protein